VRLYSSQLVETRIFWGGYGNLSTYVHNNMVPQGTELEVDDEIGEVWACCSGGALALTTARHMGSLDCSLPDCSLLGNDVLFLEQNSQVYCSSLPLAVMKSSPDYFVCMRTNLSISQARCFTIA